MSQQQRLEPGSYGDVTCDSIDREVRDVSVNDESSPEGIRADAALIERCRAGEVAAWSELYAQCHDSLLASIKIMLGPQNGDFDLVDELAARVWYALVANDGEALRKYDPNRGARAITFLRALAQDEMGRHLRAERRRRKREVGVSHGKLDHHAAAASESGASLSEFLGSLTPAERGFADECLLAPVAAQGVQGPAPKHSLANVWQLTGRVRRKLLAFLKK